MDITATCAEITVTFPGGSASFNKEITTTEIVVAQNPESEDRVYLNQNSANAPLTFWWNLNKAIEFGYNTLQELYDYFVAEIASQCGGGIESIVAGTNITVDNTDPQNPIISATGGGTPAGSDTWIQYNNAGAFGADSGFTRDVAGGNTTILNTTDFGGGEVLDGGVITTGGITTIQQVYSNASVPTYGASILIDGTEIKLKLISANIITGKQNGLEIANGFITIGDIAGGNNTKITIDDVNEQITISNLSAYDDDTAAGVGGLTAGMVYMTTGSGSAPLNAAGILMIKQ